MTKAGQTLSMSGAFTSGSGTGGWTFGGAGNLALSGAISNSGGTSVTKTGAGKLTLSNASNAYAGATTVTGGSLQVGSAGVGATGTGAVTVQNGGTLLGTGTVKGSSFTAQSGSTVHAGDSIGTSVAGGDILTPGSFGNLNFAPVSGGGNFDFQSGSMILLGINPGGVGDSLSFDGLSTVNLKLNGNMTVQADGYTPIGVDTFNLIEWVNVPLAEFDSRYSAASYSGYLYGNGDDNLGFDLPNISGSGYAWDISTFTTDGKIRTVLAVPEPSCSLLIFSGMLALAIRRRR